MNEQTEQVETLVHCVVNASIQEHRKRRNANKVSVWYVEIMGKRRKIELQEYRNRLYAVGCVYRGLMRVIDFEEPLTNIVLKWGEVRSH